MRHFSAFPDRRSGAEWKNRIGSGLGDTTATKLAATTIDHFTTQLEAIDRAISETIDQDAEPHARRDLLVSVIGVGDTLVALLMAKMPEPGVLRRSGEIRPFAIIAAEARSRFQRNADLTSRASSRIASRSAA